MGTQFCQCSKRRPPKCHDEFDWTWEQWHQEKKVKSIKEEQELICKMIYEESLSFHPEEKVADDSDQGQDSGEKDLI